MTMTWSESKRVAQVDRRSDAAGGRRLHDGGERHRWTDAKREAIERHERERALLAEYVTGKVVRP